MALNLRQFGARVAVLTAANNSPYSGFATNHLYRQGIDVIVERNDALPLSAFSAHINKAGELLGAVTSAGVEQHNFDDEIVDAALEKTNCVILECNLSQTTMEMLARKACERMLPVYIAGVSEEKCLRAVAVAPCVDALFVNKREIEYLALKQFGIEAPVDFVDIATRLSTSLVITDGQHGAYVARPKKPHVSHISSPNIGEVSNFLGMGDAFVAGTLFAHMGFDLRLDDAAKVMLPYVAGMSKRNGCNPSDPGAVDRMMDELKNTASYCPTTKIHNRATIEMELDKLIYSAKFACSTVSIAVIDVDYFKTINDTLGHNMGDQVLMVVAESLRKVLRGHDKVGRWGGDEFIALIQGDEASAIKVSERMQASVAHGCSSLTKVTLSIGVAEWKPTMDTAKALIEEADKALYAVKKNGRNAVMGASGVCEHVD